MKWCKTLLLFSCSVMSDFLRPHGLQHARLPCPSLSLRVSSNSCPLSQWCHPIISSSVDPVSSCHQSFPASGSFSVSWIFASGGQSIGASASASVLALNIQGWFPLRLTSLISLLSKGLLRVFFQYSPTICSNCFLQIYLSLGNPCFRGGASYKESACQWRRRKRLRFDPWVGKIPWRRKWQPALVFLTGKFHGQRRLVGYSA